MKKRDIEQRLRALGFSPNGGSKHEKWSNGCCTIMVPRHKEVNEFTAKGIIRDAEKCANGQCGR